MRVGMILVMDEGRDVSAIIGPRCCDPTHVAVIGGNCAPAPFEYNIATMAQGVDAWSLEKTIYFVTCKGHDAPGLIAKGAQRRIRHIPLRAALLAPIVNDLFDGVLGNTDGTGNVLLGYGAER